MSQFLFYKAASAAAANATAGRRPEVQRVQGEVDQLKYDIERILLITEALWTILKEHHGYDDEELIRRIGEIDFRDGKLDGRVASEPPSQCPHCQRTLLKNRPFCMYCGKPVAVNPFNR